MIKKCARCNTIVGGADIYVYREQPLCEDCYMGAIEQPKTCDVAATQLATKHRRAAGQTGTDGLLDIQKRIYELIREKGKVTREEAASILEIPGWELEKQVAVLRHCELVKGRKEGSSIYLVLFDS